MAQAQDMTAKIGKLLALAEKASNAEEAAAFTAKAQALSTTYQIELQGALLAHKMTGQRETPTVRRIQIGQPRKVGLGTYVELFDAIGTANNVRLTIASNSTYVNAYGFASDIDTTEQLYVSLLTQMVEASNAYIRKGEYRTEKVWREVTEVDGWGGRYTREKLAPVSGRTARISFQNSFARTIGQRLRKAAKQAATEAAPVVTDEVTGESTSGELVLASRGDEVTKHFKEATSHIRGTWKGNRSSNHSDHAHGAGREAGRNARLSGTRSIGGARTAVSA